MGKLEVELTRKKSLRKKSLEEPDAEPLWSYAKWSPHSFEWHQIVGLLIITAYSGRETQTGIRVLLYEYQSIYNCSSSP